MNTMDLQAGPELDALVAEKVMGFFGREGRYWRVPEGWVVRLGMEPIIISLADKNRQDAEPRSEVPRFSTDIDAAWQVVKLFEGRGTINLRFFQGGGPEIAWKVRIRPSILRDGDPGFEEAASTAPLAICRAALLAVPENLV